MLGLCKALKHSRQVCRLISSGSASSLAKVSMARAIPYWAAAGNCRTDSRTFSRSLVISTG
jgi:hypothetical protein